MLISNGAEQSIHYHLSNDFSIVAKSNGEVVERNEEVGMIIIKYKDGSVQAIDTKPRIVKNGSDALVCGNIYKNLC